MTRPTRILEILFVSVCGAMSAADTYTVVPPHATLFPDQEQAFKVQKNGKDLTPEETKTVTWQAEPAGGGTITAAGRFKAPKAPDQGLAVSGVVTIKAKVKFFAESEAEAAATVVLAARPLISGGEWFRSVVGFEQAAASASDRRFNYFIDLSISRPLPWRRNQIVKPGDLGPRVRGWGNVRLASVPRQANTELVTAIQNFSTEFGKLKVNELVETGEFLTGLEFRLTEFASALAGSNNNNDVSRQKVSFNLILGGGAIGPSTPQASVRLFKAPAAGSTQAAAFFQRFPAAAGSDRVAFTLPDRDRFFREYFAGIRLRTHYFDSAGLPLPRPPAVLDITYGQNEAVTQGRLYGGVLRIEAFYPLPLFDKGVFDHCLYLFGTANLKLSRAREVTPFFLEPESDLKFLFDAKTTVINVGQTNRDYYRIGIGVDFVRVFANLKKQQPPAGTN